MARLTIERVTPKLSTQLEIHYTYSLHKMMYRVQSAVVRTLKLKLKPLDITVMVMSVLMGLLSLNVSDLRETYDSS